MTRVLDRQIEAYRDGDSGSSRAPLDRRSTESEIDVGVSLFDAVKNEVRRWQQDVVDWDAPETLSQARAYDSRYRMLHDTLTKLASNVSALESAGATSAPENAEQLRAALRELAGIVCFELGRVSAADRAFREGTPTRTTTEVRDGVRRRMGG